MIALLQDYISLTKPKIISLLLVTALGGMFLAEQGIPSGQLILVVLAGGTLAAGGANALNHYMERQSDQKMLRTRQRPVASQRILAWQALTFGVALNVIAFGVLTAWANVPQCGPDPGRDRILRARLHGLSEKAHPTEHSNRRGRRRRAPDGRVGGSHRGH